MTIIKIDDVGKHIQQEGEEEMNKVTGLVAGQYGSNISLTVVDDEGTGIDLVSYTSITVRAMSPDARTTLVFSSSGGDSSGNFSILPSSGNTFDRDGTWLAQANLEATGILALSVIFGMEVERKI